MNKQIISNLLLTVTFLLVITPLFWGLFNYVLNPDNAPKPAKKPISERTLVAMAETREFENESDFAEQVTVLMYHQILPEEELQDHHFQMNGKLVDTIVTQEQFAEQMEFLADNDFTVLSLQEFEGFMKQQKKIPANSVLITFDDGFKNVFEFAYPILKKCKFHAVHFVTTGLITNKTEAFDSSNVQYASIQELMTSVDVFDYGSHTHAFHQRDEDGIAFLEAYDHKKVKADLFRSFEWLGHSIAFAPPYGAYTNDTLHVLQELGVSLSFTIEDEYANPTQSPLEIPRYGIYPSYTMQEFHDIVSSSSKKNNE